MKISKPRTVILKNHQVMCDSVEIPEPMVSGWVNDNGDSQYYAYCVECGYRTISFDTREEVVDSYYQNHIGQELS